MSKLETQLTPLVATIAELYANNILSDIISDSVQQSILSKDLSSKDFYTIEYDNNSRITLFEVNSILISQITNDISTNLQKTLRNTTEIMVPIPVGELIFIESLSNYGPTYNMGVIPLGYANVDYETVFSSVGINQTNLQVILHISTSIRVINPLYEKEFLVQRNIILINTIINGDVPSSYMPSKTYY